MACADGREAGCGDEPELGRGAGAEIDPARTPSAASVPACGSIGAFSATGGAFIATFGGGTFVGARGPPAPGSVGAIALRCSPHCWQYAKPTGVAVVQRGHVIVLPCGDTRRPAVGTDALGPCSCGPPPGAVMPFGDPIGTGVANGPGGGMPIGGGAIIGAPTAGGDA